MRIRATPDSHAPHPQESGTTLTTASPRVSPATAERIVAQHYGIVGHAKRLHGERDEIFRIDARDGRVYLLKVAHAMEEKEVTNLTTSAMLHLARTAPDLPVQHVLPTGDGDVELSVGIDGGPPRLARLTTFLDGRVLNSVPSTPELRRNIGRALARLNIALRDFDHPAARRELIWDIQRAPKLRPLVAEIEHLSNSEALIGCLDRFESVIEPRLASLRAQAAHNDLSNDNVVVGQGGSDIVGILDFGDMVHTQLANDVAVAAAYQLSDDPDPIPSAIDVVVGYDERDPLTETELTLLFDLIRTRMAVRLIISEWRADRFPENRAYILRHTPRTWAQFERLQHSSPDRVTDHLRQAVRNHRSSHA
jgi:hydroxylysine kinase